MQIVPNDDAFRKEAERFLQLIKEINEMAGMITNLAKTDRQLH